MAKKTMEEQVLRLIGRVGVIRARDVAEHHIPTVILSRMVRNGQIERTSRGVYTLPNVAMSEHRSLAEVAIRIPSAVMCLLTALRYHEIGTQSPFDVWVALPARCPTPRVEQPRARYVWMTSKSLSEGVDEVLIDGVRVKIFNPAKTIADCFKFRNKLGTDVAIEALSDAWRRKLVSMADLWYFAKVDRVTNVMRPYLESLTV